MKMTYIQRLDLSSYKLFVVTTRGQSQETHRGTKSTILSIFQSTVYIYIYNYVYDPVSLHDL